MLPMSTFEERRRARAAWPIRAVPLADETLLDERDASTVDERLALVWTLTRQLWAFSGRDLPTYERGQMPGRITHDR